MKKESQPKKSKTKERWDELIQTIESTKNLDVENVLVVPREQWNPTILSRERNRLVTVIDTEKPGSISELAEQVGRKRENVHSDLKLLEHYGIIKLEREGGKTIPRKVAQEIRLIG